MKKKRDVFEMTVEEIYLQAKSTKANGIGSKNQE